MPSPSVPPEESRAPAPLGHVVVLALAVLVGMVFQLRWLLVAVGHPSPARSIAFEDPSGTALPTNAAGAGVHCFDAMVVDGPRLWQLCSSDAPPAATGAPTASGARDAANATRNFMARFDLARGAAVLFPTPLETSAFAIHAALARLPNGHLVLVNPWGAWEISAEAGPEPLATAQAASLFPVGIGLSLGKLEVASEARNVIDTFESDGSLTRRRLAVPDTRETEDTQLVRAVLGPSGWELTYARFAHLRDHPEDQTDVELLIGGERGPFRSLGRFPLLARIPPEQRYAAATEPLLAAWDAGVVASASFASLPPSLRADGTLAWAEPPHVAALTADDPRAGIALDFEVTSAGLRPIGIVADRAVWMRGAWWSILDPGDGGLALARAGTTTRVAMARDDLLRAGLKVVPDEADANRGGDQGYWVLGGLGTQYVHLDATLVRDDGLGIGERFARLMVADGAKLRDGVLGPDVPIVGFLRRVSVVLVLGVLPLGLLVLAARRLARRQRPRAASFATRTYRLNLAFLALAGLLGPWAWDLLGYF